MNEKKTPLWIQILAFVLVVGSLGGVSFQLTKANKTLAEKVTYINQVESALEMANIERSNAIEDADREKLVLNKAIKELVAENSLYNGMDLAGMTEEEMAIAYLAEMQLRPTGVPFNVNVFRTTTIFGWRVNPITGETEFHAATDIIPSGGDRLIYPSAAGVIVDIGMDAVFGKWVLVEHNGKYRTFYAHLETILYQDVQNARVIGEAVGPEDALGVMGSTGQSTGPHLHYEVRKLVDGSWKRQNPLHYLGIR